MLREQAEMRFAERDELATCKWIQNVSFGAANNKIENFHLDSRRPRFGGERNSFSCELSRFAILKNWAIPELDGLASKDEES
jgi:hypothetical protein